VLILKGLRRGTVLVHLGPRTAYGARFPSRLRARQKAGATASHKKENAATWLPQRRLYMVVPENDYSKFWFGLKGKKSGKDNAEAQKALRFAE